MIWSISALRLARGNRCHDDSRYIKVHLRIGVRLPVFASAKIEVWPARVEFEKASVVFTDVTHHNDVAAADGERVHGGEPSKVALERRKTPQLEKGRGSSLQALHHLDYQPSKVVRVVASAKHGQHIKARNGRQSCSHASSLVAFTTTLLQGHGQVKGTLKVIELWTFTVEKVIFFGFAFQGHPTSHESPLKRILQNVCVGHSPNTHSLIALDCAMKLFNGNFAHRVSRKCVGHRVRHRGDIL